MTNLTLYRKRIIPDECVLLKDDLILSCDEEHMRSIQKKTCITVPPATS